MKNEHIALSKLRDQRQQQEQQQPYKHEQQPFQTDSSLTNNINRTIPSDIKDAKGSTEDLLSEARVASKDVPSLDASQLTKNNTAEDVSKPSKTRPVASSNTSTSLTRDASKSTVTEKPTIIKEGTSQTPKMTHYDASQVAEKSIMRQGSPIGFTAGKREEVSEPKEEDVASDPVEKYGEYYSPTVEKRPKQNNLKILVPVILVAVVGSIIGFVFFRTTTTTPPETTTTTPPETTTTTPPETTTTTPPETTTTTPPETTTTTPPETTTTTPPETTTTTPPETTTTTPPETTTTTSEKGEPKWQSVELSKDNQVYPIRYDVTGSGNYLENIDVRFDGAKPIMSASIASPSDGTLTIQVPRNVLDSKSDGNADEEFVAFADGVEFTSPDEVDTDPLTRTLTIYFDKGTKELEIVGT